MNLSFSITDIDSPQILAEESGYLIVYKPPRMHSFPSVPDYCAPGFPEVRTLTGRRAGEGGLLHRLDYETHGLMLLARTEGAMTDLLAQQGEGRIEKYYSAIVSEDTGDGNLKSGARLPGFPAEKPAAFPQGTITSAFRPYGEGRKAVRPVLIGPNKKIRKKTETAFDRGLPYVTEIIKVRSRDAGLILLELRIFKGFRHQIRSHLAWLDLPILNDSLYGGPAYGKGYLALRAFSLSFKDPSSGNIMSYSIPPLDLDMV